MECLFCKIAKGEIPSKKVDETGSLFAFRDINPVAPVHVLIIPKKHIPSHASLAPEDHNMIAEVHDLANLIAKKEGISKSGFRLVANNGPDAGQAVDHLHFHLVGGRLMLWPPG